MSHWNFVLAQEGSNAKKKVFAARNLKDCLPNLPLKTGNEKKKISVFLLEQFYALLNY